MHSWLKIFLHKILSKMNPKVDFYFIKAKKWQQELEFLRMIANECTLEEELKWGCPCYTLHKKNIVLIHAFKEYCALLFFKGALINDAKKILIQQTENVQAARQIRVTSLAEIKKLKTAIKTYINEAIAIEQSGLKVPLKKNNEIIFCEELKNKLATDATFKKAFEKLTPGRQRGYNLHFSSAKEAKTVLSRIERYTPQILIGKGFNER